MSLEFSPRLSVDVVGAISDPENEAALPDQTLVHRHHHTDDEAVGRVGEDHVEVLRLDLDPSGDACAEEVLGSEVLDDKTFRSVDRKMIQQR